MEEITCSEFLETQFEKRWHFLETHLIPKQKEHDAAIKEFDKATKLFLRALKTENFGPFSRHVDSAAFKEIMGCHDENDCPNEEQIDKSSVTNIRVKREKLSICSNSSTQSIKNDAEHMPAPKMPPPKTRRVKKEKKSDVTKVKQEPTSAISRVTRSREDRSSDVILQNPVVPVIDLVDSSEEQAPVRSTRARTKKKEQETSIRSTRTRKNKEESAKEEEEILDDTKTRTKRDRSESGTEVITTESKRQKSDSGPEDESEINTSSHTDFQDALSHLEPKLPNTTFTTEKSPLGIGYETVIIDKPNYELTHMNKTNDMITDDESIEEPAAAPMKPEVKQANKNKIFSSYENSPVKKKVEAFEKLQKNENTPVTKMNTSKVLKEIESKKGFVKEQAKGFVGSSTSSKTNPSSASKIGKYIGGKSLLSTSKLMTPKSACSFRERELKRQEKEKEQKKKETLKQALSVERKKRYEEKVLEVQQQQKEALQKEKEKALEIQRLKEERYKMAIQQKEEKRRLLKEENERKRILAKQRAEEKKKEEEAQRLAAQAKKEKKIPVEQHNSSKVPIYLLKPTPPLPSNDCYDSDDERYTEKKPGPTWASSCQSGVNSSDDEPYVKRQDLIQTAAGHKIKNTLFCCQSQHIDLVDVFQRIDPKKLKRTSSANWDKPPRFTILPSTSSEK